MTATEDSRTEGSRTEDSRTGTSRTGTGIAGPTRSPLRRAADRWPTALALGAFLLTWGLDVTAAGELLPLLPLIY